MIVFNFGYLKQTVCSRPTLFTISSHGPEGVAERSKQIDVMPFADVSWNVLKHNVKILEVATNSNRFILRKLCSGVVASLFHFTFDCSPIFAWKVSH